MTIISDCWAACNGIEDMGREYTHHAVNHSKEFVDEDGNHTNNMEASWRTIRIFQQVFFCQLRCNLDHFLI
jgi:hypothetical protein